MSDAAICVPRWEYASLCRQSDKNMVAVLNKVGVQGWEAISVTYNKDLKGIWAWTAFLRRPLASGAMPTEDINDLLDGISPEGQEKREDLSRFQLPEGDFELKD